MHDDLGMSPFPTGALGQSASGDGASRASAPTRDEGTVLTEVYEELRRRARRMMRSEPAGHSLDPTALVHEAYARLTAGGRAPSTRAEYVSLATLAMRRILVDRARRVRRSKRSSSRTRAPLASVQLSARGPAVDPLVVEETLRRLEAKDATLAATVTAHDYFGMTVDEVSRDLGHSAAKVKKDLAFARAWLRREMAHDARA
jgi:RNA polymerase sigma factor (TIGR02999 family)